MTVTSLPLFAEGAQGVTRTMFEFGRIQSNADWILPVGVCVGVMLFVRALYRRDAMELHPALGWLLSALRTATFLGLLILYLQPQWRSEHEVVHNARALLLVDTSLSMGLTDSASTEIGTAKSRAERVAAALKETDFLEHLRKSNDVVVCRFNEGLDRDRVALAKLDSPPRADRQEDSDDDTENSAPADGTVDWVKFLTPGGTETRLGTALRQLINEESGSPLSGILIFSDGGQNAGVTPEVAIGLARKAHLRILTVGLGSERKPANVRVSDLVAPARAYPGDSYVVTGYVQAQGMPGQTVDVQLLSRPSRDVAAGTQNGTGKVEATEQVTLGGEGEVVPVKFELTPEETGQRTLCFRIEDVPQDRNLKDNYREADIEIVDRKNRVLMLAGGPTREYRFLRSQLYRDRSTTLDVLLQSGQPGMSQEADKLLDDFPTTREEMFDYDCLLAFDPNWQVLSPEQVGLLEEWVAEKGGGLIVIAGPIFTGTMIRGWIESPAMAKIRALYPVEFHRRFSVLEEGLYVTEEAWPLEFTREGLQAECLWLEDTATAGREAWAGFAGVYGYCPVKGPKPGATVLSRFSDPRTGQAGQRPVFFAEQFYGSGRVFFIGSGEMWRLRQLDDTYFERFYTKLIRHVSQGRLLRGSSRGVLLTGQDRYLLGNTVELRAQLTNSLLQPLEAPSVTLQIIGPDGAVQTVALRPDPSRVGTYAGRFAVLKEGSYRLELPVPESKDERLIRRIQVKVPDLERENPERNDALLSRIAKPNDADRNRGEYYVGLSELLDPPSGKRSALELLRGHPKIEYIADAPDPLWEETWLRWMMLTLCGLLCLEWLIRRLAKLA